MGVRLVHEYNLNSSHMKTLHILLLACSLFVMPAAVSANDGRDSSNASIACKIQKTVHAPESSSADTQSRIFVVFSIAENGSVAVQEVGTLDASVKQSITEQFQSMSFDNAQGNYDGMYSIWLNFKTL